MSDVLTQVHQQNHINLLSTALLTTKTYSSITHTLKHHLPSPKIWRHNASNFCRITLVMNFCKDCLLTCITPNVGCLAPPHVVCAGGWGACSCSDSLRTITKTGFAPIVWLGHMLLNLQGATLYSWMTLWSKHEMSNFNTLLTILKYVDFISSAQFSKCLFICSDFWTLYLYTCHNICVHCCFNPWHIS